MAAPIFEITADPGLDGKIYYLPLAPQSKDHKERYKVCARLRLVNKTAGQASVKITGISLSFPGKGSFDMEMVPEKNMEPENGVVALNAAATWHNGSWREDEDAPAQYNQVYLDGPAPTKMTVSVTCDGFTRNYIQTFDLIRWGDPTGDGPLLLPFVRHELDDDEYVVTSARHFYNGGNSGTQIFAYDISIQARRNGEWSGARVANPTKNTDSRVFGRPVRGMGDGEVIDVIDGYGPGPYHSTAEGFWDNDYGAGNRTDHYGSNTVWVRYGDLEVGYMHLKRGSIAVETGDAVWPGRKLAEAGNSGNTKGSPHLHMECRVASNNRLCAMTFRNTWQLERELVPADNGPGRRVRIDDQGVCEQAAALRPFATQLAPPTLGRVDVEYAEIAAEVFGGVSKGGDGFVIVNGKLKRVPPRGIKGALLQAIVELEAAEEMERKAGDKAVAAATAKLQKALAAGVK